jgi:hypothetical protein
MNGYVVWIKNGHTKRAAIEMIAQNSLDSFLNVITDIT